MRLLVIVALVLGLAGCGGGVGPGRVGGETRPRAGERPPAVIAQASARTPYVQVRPAVRAYQHPLGAMILIHGGGWTQTGRSTMLPLVPLARHLNKIGWQTFNTDYRARGQSLPDVLRVYDTVRARVGPRVPICAVGNSAGGNLALLLAVARPELACAISWAGPTDLLSLNDPRLPVYYSVHALATSIGNNLAAWSPAKLAQRMRARVLLLYAIDDPLVPISEGREMQASLPRAHLILLRSGRAGFVHSPVNRGELSRAIKVEDRLLASVARTRP